MRVHSLDEEIRALVPDNTPNVLSLGRRCMEQGYSFTWHAYSRPELVTPNGDRVVLDVRDNIPYLPRSALALPARREAPAHSVSDARDRGIDGVAKPVVPFSSLHGKKDSPSSGRAAGRRGSFAGPGC